MTERDICLRLDVRRALGHLDSLERRAVVLISLADLTTREAAWALCLPETTCRRIHGRGLEKLRRHLNAHSGQ